MEYRILCVKDIVSLCKIRALQIVCKLFSALSCFNRIVCNIFHSFVVKLRILEVKIKCIRL